MVRVDDDVEILTLPATHVAYMRYVGPYGSPAITEMWQRFRPWCREQGLLREGRRMFGVAQDNANITPPDRTRYDACMEIDGTFRATEVVGIQVVRGGTFACVPFRGTVAEIGAAWVRLLGRTLPQLGLEPDLLPALELFAPDLVIDDETGRFSCRLCMPLRST